MSFASAKTKRFVRPVLARIFALLYIFASLLASLHQHRHVLTSPLSPAMAAIVAVAQPAHSATLARMRLAANHHRAASTPPHAFSAPDNDCMACAFLAQLLSSGTNAEVVCRPIPQSLGSADSFLPVTSVTGRSSLPAASRGPPTA